MTHSSADTYQNVWLSSKARAESQWKFLVYDDKGALQVDDEKLCFTGADQSIEIHRRDIDDVTRRSPVVASSLHWVLIGIASCLSFLTGWMDGSIGYALIGAAVYPGIYVLGGDRIGKSFSLDWTVVSYRSNSQISEAWFVNGRALGWAAKFGDKTELHQRIERLFESERR